MLTILLTSHVLWTCYALTVHLLCTYSVQVPAELHDAHCIRVGHVWILTCWARGVPDQRRTTNMYWNPSRCSLRMAPHGPLPVCRYTSYDALTLRLFSTSFLTYLRMDRVLPSVSRRKGRSKLLPVGMHAATINATSCEGGVAPLLAPSSHQGLDPVAPAGVTG